MLVTGIMTVIFAQTLFRMDLPAMVLEVVQSTLMMLHALGLNGDCLTAINAQHPTVSTLRMHR